MTSVAEAGPALLAWSIVCPPGSGMRLSAVACTLVRSCASQRLTALAIVGLMSTGVEVSAQESFDIKVVAESGMTAPITPVIAAA